MVAMLHFDPSREPVTPKDAATVVVAREAGDRIEIFCVKRHAQSGFLGGAVVFPGGKLSPDDHEAEWAELGTPITERARSVAPSESHARAFAVAALRETLEEAGILPVVGAGMDDAAIAALRADLAERATRLGDDGRAFRELCRDRGIRIDTARIEVMSRWITPKAEQRRYDTRFYVLGAPRGQTGRHDDRETTSSFWATPSEILGLWEKGEIFLAPPTVRTVQLLAPAHSIDEVFAIARRQPLEPTCPHFVMAGELAVLALPGDPLYPEPRPAPSDPTAPTRFVLTDGRFVPERAV
jgi:8-oxo-dGTP pyrophosphatase MutT (NUDIX family)